MVVSVVVGFFGMCQFQDKQPECEAESEWSNANEKDH